jgi:DNA mismatch endonuclease, patch repair protein
MVRSLASHAAGIDVVHWTPMPSRTAAIPKALDETVARRMAATGGRDTAAELAVRSALHARGLRYRVDIAPLRGIRRRADVVFTRARVAVFIDGCFWHGCPEHATWPRHNAEFWRAKIETNRQRDLDTDRRLSESGWEVVRVWEHEAPSEVADRVEAMLDSRRPLCVVA